MSHLTTLFPLEIHHLNINWLDSYHNIHQYLGTPLNNDSNVFELSRNYYQETLFREYLSLTPDIEYLSYILIDPYQSNKFYLTSSLIKYLLNATSLEDLLALLYDQAYLNTQGVSPNDAGVHALRVHSTILKNNVDEAIQFYIDELNESLFNDILEYRSKYDSQFNINNEDDFESLAGDAIEQAVYTSRNEDSMESFYCLMPESSNIVRKNITELTLNSGEIIEVSYVDVLLLYCLHQLAMHIDNILKQVSPHYRNMMDDLSPSILINGYREYIIEVNRIDPLIDCHRTGRAIYWSNYFAEQQLMDVQLTIFAGV